MPFFGTVTERNFRGKIQSIETCTNEATLRFGFFPGKRARSRSRVFDFFRDSRIRVKRETSKVEKPLKNIIIRDQELLEAKNLLRLAKSEISSTEKINGQLMSSIESVRSENSIKLLDSQEKNSELALSKQLIRKLQREIEIYKNFLSKTST